MKSNGMINGILLGGVGLGQMSGMDRGGSFAPVFSLHSTRNVLVLVLELDCSAWQLDVLTFKPVKLGFWSKFRKRCATLHKEVPSIIRSVTAPVVTGKMCRASTKWGTFIA